MKCASSAAVAGSLPFPVLDDMLHAEDKGLMCSPMLREACSCRPDVFPIPGTKRLKYLEENAAAFFVELTQEDKHFLEDTFHEDKVSIGLHD